jgi:hypothetical protein
LNVNIFIATVKFNAAVQASFKHIGHNRHT